MLTSIEVRNAIGVLVATLPISAVTADARYSIKDITGLGPVKADINTSPHAIQDGGYFQSARTGERNIVMKIGTRPVYNGETVLTQETLRRDFYKVFPPKGLVTLRFFNADPQFQTVEIVGYVESNEPDIFSQEPMIQVSIVCPKPNFVELQPMVRTGNTHEPLEFPYRGDAETGFFLELYVQSDLTKVVINNSRVDEDLVLDFPAPSKTLLKGRGVLNISTVANNKYITAGQFASETNMLSSLSYGSLSMSLGPIVNSLNVSVIPVPGQSSALPYQVTCVPAYVGL